MGLLVFALADSNQKTGNLGDTVYKGWPLRGWTSTEKVGGLQGGNGCSKWDIISSVQLEQHASLPGFFDRILCGHWARWAPRP